MNKLLPIACLALLTGAAANASWAAGQPAAPEAAPTPAPAPAPADNAVTLPQVTVTGGRVSDMDARRESTAGKQVYGREELDRNGDTNLGDVLKRLPGVTLGGRPGRGGEIRMRGLGSGYTQVLLNGERPPAGFSMDSLSPDQVERVEVMRGPVAEYSTRAIAGTINVVLREGYQQRDTQLKLSDTIERGEHSLNLAVTAPGKIGALSYSLSGSAYDSHQDDFGATHNRDVDGAGALERDQLLTEQSERHARGVHLAPRFSYRFDNGDTLNFQPFLMRGMSDGSADSALEQRAGTDAKYTSAHTVSSSSNTFVRGFGNWLHKLEGGAKLDVKGGAGAGRSASSSLRKQNNTDGTLHSLDDNDSTRDNSASTGGKYTTPLGAGHLLAAGWDTEWNRRKQSRVSLDNNVARFAESGDTLDANTRRLAGFVQDEWDITPQWSAYAGLRWEGIRTESALAGADVSNQSRVWSPLLHGVWRIPGHDKDQVRASLTNSYRAPTLNNLIALPVLSNDNTKETSPDRVGNPNLKPELARGIDLAYEHDLGNNGIVSVSGFVRDIDNLMRRQTTDQGTAAVHHYVSTPINIGHARTSGIELEAKFKLAELMDDAPAIDLRSNYSRFWSRVDDIPGPNNRLEQQAKQTANFGLDYRMKDRPLTLGGSLNWTPAVVVQTSETEQASTGPKRIVDLYGLWKFDARTQLRVSVNNLLAEEYDSASVIAPVAPINGLKTASTNQRTDRTWSVKLETKF
jgi:outer membrane receptor for ferrienterochelin and colicins